MLCEDDCKLKSGVTSKTVTDAILQTSGAIKWLGWSRMRDGLPRVGSQMIAVDREGVKHILEFAAEMRYSEYMHFDIWMHGKLKEGNDLVGWHKAGSLAYQRKHNMAKRC